MDCDSPTTELPEWVISMEQKSRQTEQFQPKTEEKLKNGRKCIYDAGDECSICSFGLYPNWNERGCIVAYVEDALVQFLRRSEKPLKQYYKAVAAVVEELKNNYDELHPKWQDDPNKFLKLMVIDGCFLLDVLRGPRDSESYYTPDDRVLSIHKDPGLMERFRHDVLVLRNQLPMRLLEVLLEVETGDNHKACEILEDCIAKMFSMQHIRIRYDQNNKCKHILDAYRRGLLGQVARNRKAKEVRRSSEATSTGRRFHDFNIPSVTELDKAGIRFTASDTTFLTDISFRRKTLSLPQIVVDGETHSRFFNIIAFEQRCEDVGNEVTSYIYFMRSLIQGANDVGLLQSWGIINSALPILEVVQLFRGLCGPIELDKPLADEYWEVGTRLRQGYDKMRNHEWRKDLFQNYLRSPWTVISVIAATFLLILTTIQTVYTVFSYYNPK